VFARAALVLGHAAQPMDVFASTVRDRSQDPTR
jgi:hypothetical protein